MAKSGNRLLIVQAAALGYDLAAAAGRAEWRGMTFRPMEAVFPAVTCVAQASFRTASLPACHGMVANGFLFREIMRPLFWEQASALVAGRRIWEAWRGRGKRVAMLFWQQSLGECADAILSPAPIHTHGGGMIPACYSRPAGLYERLRAAVGRDFRLAQYWGPLASARSSAWIAEATAALLEDRELAPDLCLTYLPALDYDLQRFGPSHPRARAAVAALFDSLGTLADAAERQGYEMLVFGDYAIGPARAAGFPNRALRREGLLACRNVGGRLYPDFCSSSAFAVVDHELAHVYVRDRRERDRVRAVLHALSEAGEVLDEDEQAGRGMRHARSGEFVLVARQERWFAYPWWEEPAEAPDYAGHVDIHNKPGYDPCELFFGWPPGRVSSNTDRVRGSHGRAGADRAACWAATFGLDRTPAGLVDLAAAVKTWLESTP